MDFKKYNKIIVVIMIFIFVATIGAVIYNIKIDKDNINNNVITNQNVMKVQLYFIDSTNSTLKQEERNISKGNGTKEDITSNILEALISGPKNQAYKKSIPENVKILEVELDGEIANVDLSLEYNDLKASDASFCRAALVYTLTNLDFVKEVKILADGKELLKANGEVLGVMAKDDIVMGDPVTPELVQYETFKLYFSNTDGSELIVEERQIEVNPNQEKAKYIMEQLIAGPKNTELVATVPPETKIRDIKTKDGVCYVDLSKDFIEKHSGGSMAEAITIDSIVNSLTEIPEIKKVQFLIEAEKQQVFTGHLDFSKPFERTIE